jgi:hypothetical protein
MREKLSARSVIREPARKSERARPAPRADGSELVMERFGTIGQMDRSFDIEYWQRQGDAAIFRAAWDLVEAYWRDRGRDPDELRLQRSVEAFQRL